MRGRRVCGKRGPQDNSDHHGRETDAAQESIVDCVLEEAEFGPDDVPKEANARPEQSSNG